MRTNVEVNNQYFSCSLLCCALFFAEYFTEYTISGKAFPTIISTFYLPYKYVHYCLYGHLGKKERSENARGYIGAWKPGFHCLGACALESIKCTAISCSLPKHLPYVYAHTYIHSLLGFKCKKCIWLSPEVLYYACTEYSRNKMCQFWWNAMQKWHLCKSWCMTSLLQTWFRLGGVGLHCGGQISPLYFCLRWEGCCSVSSLPSLLLSDDSFHFNRCEYMEPEILLISFSLTSSYLSLPLFCFLAAFSSFLYYTFSSLSSFPTSISDHFC